MNKIIYLLKSKIALKQELTFENWKQLKCYKIIIFKLMKIDLFIIEYEQEKYLVE